MKGIVGYTAKATPNGVELNRSYAGVEEHYLATDWDDLADWLTVYYPNSLHIVWNLDHFANNIFSLLPADKRKELTTSNKVLYNRAKIFYVDRLLGITVMKPIDGNKYQREETNLYAIQRWLPGVIKAPPTAGGVAELGEQILEALAQINIEPEKLTSPIGIQGQMLAQYNLPTIWSNEDGLFIDACNYCLNVARYEWRQEFKARKGEVYNYDLISAYPYFISNLPDTDKCSITYSKSLIPADYAILKGEVEINSTITPIPCDTTDGDFAFGVTGKWQTFLALEEWLWLQKYNVGSFKMEDGYFFNWQTDRKPYRSIVSQLFRFRGSDSPILEHIVKNTAQGLSGKLDQINNDGGYGELFNPVLAHIVRSRCRLAVGDFIYQNNLLDSLIGVVLDGVKTTKQVELEDIGQLGSWRLKN